MKEHPSIRGLSLSAIERKGLTHLVGVPYVPEKPKRERKPLDKRQQFSMSYWYELIMRDYKKLRPKERTRIALTCWQVIASKIQSLPASPEESVLNTNAAMDILKGIETGMGNELKSALANDLKHEPKSGEIEGPTATHPATAQGRIGPELKGALASVPVVAAQDTRINQGT